MFTSRRLTRTVAGALAITAIAAPTATALPAEMIQNSATPAARVLAPAPAPTVTRTVDKGFDWGSGAIGAGIAGAVLLLAGAGTSAMSGRGRFADAR